MTNVDDNHVGNFNVTIDDLFSESQASQCSPTLQLADVKSQSTNVFTNDDDDDDDDDDIDDDELLQAFNKHMSSSVNEQVQPSPVLVLSNRVATQHQANVPHADVTMPKFDLEFSFDDFETNDDHALET
jgi:hypothetical protein